jgi:hypothetical protein
MDIMITVAEIYVAAGVAFAGYSLLEISSLQRQSDASRDKNLKNTLAAQAKVHLVDIKSSWMWPVVIVKSAVSAVKWLKTLD